MSRVTYVPLSGSRSAAALNTILQDIANALGNVNSANLAEEGLDQTVFAAESHGERRSLVVRETRTVIAPTGAWGVLAMGDGNVRTGALGDLPDGSALRIRTLVSCSSAVSGGDGFDNTGDSYEFRHVYNDGADNVVTASNHSRRGLEVAGFIRYAHGDMMRESWLVGPIPGLDYIELQTLNVGAGNMRVQRAHLIVDEFKRVLVS